MTAPTLRHSVKRAEELLIGSPHPLADDELRARIRHENAESASTIVVLDDDPTGSQSVHDIPVLTRWEPEDLAWAFGRRAAGFFILTNTRGLNAEDARAVMSEVAVAIEEASIIAGTDTILITRSDSTLRGHYPLETDLLIERARDAGSPYDVLLIAPAYIAAGRVTAGNVHYVGVDDSFIPVGHTGYARDATFGFVSSDLRYYIAEKTNDAIMAEDVQSLSLEDIRTGGVQRVRDVILACRDATPVVVNATTDSDLSVVALGIIEAERTGIRTLARSGPSFVAARFGITDRAPLTHAEIFPDGDRPGHGLIVVGSHVELTTRQVAGLVAAAPDLTIIEVDVPRLLEPAHAADELVRCADAVRAALATSDVLLVTSRVQIVGDSGHSSLVIAQTVSAALTRVAADAVDSMPVSWVLAKGGITSSDVATAGLRIRRATVAGQLFDGIVSVWVHEGGDEPHLEGLPYVVFAGNVGTDSTLADAVQILRGDRL